MWYVVHHEGVPVGRVELTPRVGLAAGELLTLPGYEIVRARVDAASAVLWATGVFGPPAPPSADTDADLEARTALATAAALGLELRDDHGRPVPTTFVNLLSVDEFRGEVLAVVRFADSHAGVGAALGARSAARHGHA
jgi:hypothetical protein